MIRRLEAKPVADLHRLRHAQHQFSALVTRDRADRPPAVVRLCARDVLTPRPAAVHPTGEAATEDLDERLDFGLRWRRGFAARHAVQKLSVRARDRGDVFRLLLAALDLEAPDARLG